MKLLMLNAYFQPEQIAFTHLEKDLLDAFTAEGFEINIVTPIPTRGIDEKTRKEYADKKEETLYNGAVKVHRFWAPQEGRNPILRALRYFWCNLRTYQIGKKFTNTDVILAGSTPPTQGLIATFVKRSIQKRGNKNVKFIYNLQDIFPDSMVNAGLTSSTSLLWKVGKKIENFTYENATKIITISNAFKKNIVGKGVAAQEITVIPNWVDTSVVYNIDRKNNKMYKKYNLDYDKFYISYSGNIGHSQNLELLIEVAKEIEKKTDQIKFVLIGDGAAKKYLSDTIDKDNIRNIILLPLQPYADIAHVFSLGDVGLIISKSGIGSSSIPSKTWSIMAAEKPVLASFDEDSELSELIRSEKFGIAVDSNDLKGMIDSIMKLYNNRDLIELYSENAWKFIADNCNKKNCVQKYCDLFYKIYGEKTK